MPHAVQAASAIAVLPYSLASAFQRSESYPVDVNRYSDGSVQTQAFAIDSRKSWRLSRRVTSAQLLALAQFYLARTGPLEEFTFYDVWETVPIFSYDNTGAAVAGQYTVRFAGPFQVTLARSRDLVDGLALIEVD